MDAELAELIKSREKSIAFVKGKISSIEGKLAGIKFPDAADVYRQLLKVQKNRLVKLHAELSALQAMRAEDDRQLPIPGSDGAGPVGGSAPGVPGGGPRRR